MKKYLWLFSLAIIGNAGAATPWWEQPTICRLNPTNCYANMGAGYDSGLWDATANCWGIKYICPDALSPIGTEAKPVGRGDIARGTGISSDFDVNVLNGDCFGARKTSANGTIASVNGHEVHVWCPGVLTRPDETVANGEIMHNASAEPTCTTLAESGYAGIVNNKCYGKYYGDDYFIECGTTAGIQPKTLIILNGADYTTSGNITWPTDLAAAKTIFDDMYSTSQTQHALYFK